MPSVIVATIRALKMHGGVGRIVAGKPLDPALAEENVDAVRRGAENLAKQVENIGAFNVPTVVAINAFPTDTPGEVAAIQEVARAAGARDAVVATHWAEGGRGAEPLARAVWAAAEEGAPDFRLLYPDDAPLRDKIEAIATRIYGAAGVEYQPAAAKALRLYEELGFGHLPVCMAKTQYSLSHDATLKGPTVGLRPADPRGAPVRRGRLHHPALRRDADDARAAVEAGRREHRHRRRGQHRRPVLMPPRGAEVPGWANPRQDERPGDDQPGHDAERAGAPGDPVDRTERLLGVGVVVVAVRLAVVAEPVRLAGHRRVAGVRVARMRIAHRWVA